MWLPKGGALLTFVGVGLTPGRGRSRAAEGLLLHPVHHLVDLFELLLGVRGVPFAGGFPIGTRRRRAAAGASGFAGAASTATGRSGGMHPMVAGVGPGRVGVVVVDGCFRFLGDGNDRFGIVG